MQQEREQISVPLPPEVRRAVEHVARREDRTVAAQVRHWISEGLAAARAQEAA